MATHRQLPKAVRRNGWAALVGLATVVAVVLGVVLLVSFGQAAAQPAQQAGAQYQVTLTVGSGAVYGLPQGSSVTLPISVSVSGAVGLAAASVLVAYDPAQLSPLACERRPGAPYGYCNTAYDPAKGLIRFNILSDAGLLGEVGLFDLTFEAASTATVRTEIAVTPLVESIADAHGAYMTSWTAGSLVKIQNPAGGGAVVYVGAPSGPSPIGITRGLTATVPVAITGVTGLGSASFSLSFNPAVVRPLACRPVPRADGSASGTCALHIDHVAANLLSAAGVSGTPAAPLTAFEVVFTTAPGVVVNAESALNLALGAFADPAGAPITVRLVNNALKVTKTAGASVPLLRLAPQDQDLTDDARVTVHVYLDNGAQLAAGTWAIRYDPLVVQAEMCQLAAGLFSAVCNATGEPGAVRMSVLSTAAGGPPAEIGAVTFRRHPQAKAGQASSLVLDVSNFANLADEQLAYNTQNGNIGIASELGTLPGLAMSLVGVPPYPLPQGTDLDFPIRFEIDPARPIANLTASIHYDPRVLRPTQCLLNKAAPGSPAVYCNAEYDRQAGIMRFNLLAPEGISGTLTPFTFTVEAASTSKGGDNSPLHFTVEAVAGPNGEPRTWSATDETVQVKVPVPAPRVLVGSPATSGTAIYTVTLGYTATVPLWVEAVPDLGAGTVEVRYDAAIVRATRCTLRTDLAPTLDGGFCSLLPGVVRLAWVSSQGITGTLRLYDIVFAQAPNAVAGASTPLTILVDNFVDIDEVPVPTSERDGRLDIGCYAPAVSDLYIARSGADLRLSWTSLGSPAAQYQVWRADGNAYFEIGDTGSQSFAPLAGPAAGAGVVFTDPGAWASGSNHYYVVRSLCAPVGGSLPSNRVGKFVRTLLSEWNLVSWPLLVYDPAPDAVLGTQLNGTASPYTADRALVWDGTAAAYTSAWFCAGPVCQTWGEPYFNHWLGGSPPAPSGISLPPDMGFWIQNRTGITETVRIVGAVPEAARTVAIERNWRLLGRTFPELPGFQSLDAAQLPAVGTASPYTADRVLVWDEVAQAYRSAWYCSGFLCEAWGSAYANHWLSGSPPRPSDIVLQPGYGFWFQNRHDPATWISVR